MLGLMSTEVRRILFTAIIVSTIRYAAVLLTNVNVKQLKIINVLITKRGERQWVIKALDDQIGNC